MEDLFKGLPVRKFRRGQILIYEGDPIDNIYLLVQGYVKVFNILVSGSQRTIIIYKPGEAFPLASFLSGEGVTRYFYECMTDVEVKIRPQAKFQEMIRGDMELGEELIIYTYGMSQQFIERIETLSAQSSRSKLISLLVYLSRKTGEKTKAGVRLAIPLTTKEIADMCGLTRETASLQLMRLRKEGVLSGHRYLCINDKKLQELSDD